MPAGTYPPLSECQVPIHGLAVWILDEPPGSPIARERGCACPTEQPPREARAFVFSFTCPLHELVLI